MFLLFSIFYFSIWSWILLVQIWISWLVLVDIRILIHTGLNPMEFQFVLVGFWILLDSYLYCNIYIIYVQTLAMLDWIKCFYSFQHYGIKRLEQFSTLSSSKGIYLLTLQSHYWYTFICFDLLQTYRSYSAINHHVSRCKTPSLYLRK
jgi:hypothetical protein